MTEKKLSKLFGLILLKRRLVNTATTSLNTITGQMTEMSSRKKQERAPVAQGIMS